MQGPTRLVDSRAAESRRRNAGIQEVSQTNCTVKTMARMPALWQRQKLVSGSLSTFRHQAYEPGCSKRSRGEPIKAPLLAKPHNLERLAEDDEELKYSGPLFCKIERGSVELRGESLDIRQHLKALVFTISVI